METLSCAVREHRDSIKKTSTPKHPVYRTSKLQPEMSAAVYIFFRADAKVTSEDWVILFSFSRFFL